MICALWGDTKRSNHGRGWREKERLEFNQTCVSYHVHVPSILTQKNFALGSERENENEPLLQEPREARGKERPSVKYQGGVLFSTLTFLLLCVVSAHQRFVLFVSAW